ncbi:MAG: NADPH:quinone oxidoreductase family protein [Pseudomonadota bacterium]|nr:NADPH:quinone oxidoreductase family protein [Pseudomonadota bacterium]
MAMSIRTYRCHRIDDDITTISLDEVSLPSPAPNEVQVRLKACAVNFPDILMIQGKYQKKPPLPFAPGGEAAGDVIATGSEVTNVNAGDAVIVSCGHGGFAEAINIESHAVRPMPAGMDYAAAASFQTAYLTAWVALSCRGQLQSGEHLLVHGATGGVGMAAVDLGKYLGATVIATGGRDDKLAVVKSRGADHVLNYSLDDGRMGGFRDEVKALTDGRGVDVVYDPVGGDVFDESMRCVNIDARLLTIGFTSGRWPQAAVNLILIKQLSVIGVRAGEYGRTYPNRGIENQKAIYDLAASGAIRPYVCKAFPIEDAVEAMQMLESRNVIGKCVVTMNGYEPQLN